MAVRYLLGKARGNTGSSAGIPLLREEPAWPANMFPLLVMAIITLGASACLTGCGTAGSTLPEIAPQTTQPRMGESTLNDTESRLSAIMIPRVDLRQANIKDVVRFFNQCVQDYGGPAESHDELRIQFIHSIPDDALPDLWITMSLTQITLLEALRCVTDISGCEYMTIGRLVIISWPY